MIAAGSQETSGISPASAAGSSGSSVRIRALQCRVQRSAGVSGPVLEDTVIVSASATTWMTRGARRRSGTRTGRRPVREQPRRRPRRQGSAPAPRTEQPRHPGRGVRPVRQGGGQQGRTPGASGGRPGVDRFAEQGSEVRRGYPSDVGGVTAGTQIAEDRHRGRHSVGVGQTPPVRADDDGLDTRIGAPVPRGSSGWRRHWASDADRPISSTVVRRPRSSTGPTR